MKSGGAAADAYTARVRPLNQRYVVTLAVVAVLILVVGGVLRPRPRPEQPPVVETDLARLGRLAERRALDSASAFFAPIADDVAPALVWFDGPGLTGIAWGGQVVVTAGTAPRSRPMTITHTAGAATARGGDWSPDSPVATVLLETAPSLSPPLRAPVPAASGAPAIAVWQSARGRVFAPATFIAESAIACDGLPAREIAVTLPLARAMSGGGLFDLDGGLLGVILPCDGRFAAIVPDVVDAWLRTNATAGSRFVARFGLVLEPMTEAEAAFFRVSSGAVVRELRAGGAADVAGLRPGDIVIALEGEPVTGPDDLQALVGSAPAPTVRLSVQRGSQALAIEMPGDGGAGREPGVEDVITAEPPPAAVRIEALAPDGPLAVAGLRVGDRVVRVGGRDRVSAEQIRRTLQATDGPPVFVEYERDGHRRGALVVRKAR